MKDEKITKVHNQLIKLDLTPLGVIERRFLMSFFYLCKDKTQGAQIVISHKDLGNLGIYAKKAKISEARLRKEVNKLFDKCEKFKFHTIIDDGDYFKEQRFPLFYEFELSGSRSKGTFDIRFKVHKNAVPFLNNVLKNFTTFPLEEFQTLGSTYTQDLYLHLKQFQYQGWYQISKEELYQLLNIPPSFRDFHVQNRIFNRAKIELEPFFPDLKILSLYKGNRRNTITHYRFEWTPKARPLGKEATIAEGQEYATYGEVLRFLDSLNEHVLTIDQAWSILKNHPEVKNWKAYLLGVIENKKKAQKKNIPVSN